MVQTRGPAGKVLPRTFHYCSDLMSSCHMPDAVHAHASVLMHVVTHFTSWVSTRQCSRFERRMGHGNPQYQRATQLLPSDGVTDPTAMNKQQALLHAQLQVHGACCFLHVACFMVRVINTHAMRVKVLGALGGTHPSRRRHLPALWTCRLRVLD